MVTGVSFIAVLEHHFNTFDPGTLHTEPVHNLNTRTFGIYSHCVVYVCTCMCLINLFVGRCLATKVFIGKLPATGGVWMIIE